MKLEDIQTKLLKFTGNTHKISSTERHLVGIRGCSVNAQGELTWNDDKIDVFNDTVFVIESKIIRPFEATLDPGLRWILKPMAGVLGTARIKQGRYIYKPGLHKKIPAFVQAAQVTVQRDVNKNAVWEVIEPTESGWFAINIHPKLANTKNVAGNSAGCTVINSMRDEKPWMEFYGLLKDMKQFNYVVLNQEFAKALLAS